MQAPETHLFAADGRFPNSALPLLLYRAALPADPASMEATFATNGWSNAWRDGMPAQDPVFGAAGPLRQ
jgi:uncharacterized protein YjlB